MARKVKWGVLSTAKIGVEKVIPAMQKGNFSEVVAIASRDAEKARSTANRLGIPRVFGSYDELLRDPEVEAVDWRQLEFPATTNGIPRFFQG